MTVSEVNLDGSCAVTGAMQLLPGTLFSQHLQAEKPIWVYLPPSYDQSPDRRYPVLYMQDGQALFDPATSISGQEWMVDETLDALSAARQGDFIAVGIPASDDRLAEYSPYATEQLQQERGKAYVSFLTQELMPHINASFRTHTGPEHTAIVGSSMGALVSFYAVLEHHAHFGTAGIFSLAQADCVPTADFLVEQVHAHGPSAARRVFIYYGGHEMDSLPIVSQKLHEAFSHYPNHQTEIATHPDAEHQEQYWGLAFEQFIAWHCGGER